jgi:hypothetical protein
VAKRDEKGYIHYSQEELERIPSFEERDGRMPGAAGLTGGALGALAGGTVGAAAGPGVGLAGLATGAVLGNQAARSTGAGAGQGADRAGFDRENGTESPR